VFIVLSRNTIYTREYKLRGGEIAQLRVLDANSFLVCLRDRRYNSNIIGFLIVLRLIILINRLFCNAFLSIFNIVI
jgi:hypothetical protein